MGDTQARARPNRPVSCCPKSLGALFRHERTHCRLKPDIRRDASGEA